MLREIVTNEWYTVFLVISLCILAFAKYAYANRFHDFLSLVGNSKYLKIYAREQKFIDQFDSLLFVNLVVSLSIFTFLSYQNLVDPIDFEITTFLKLLVGVGALILIKILLERLIGSLFEIDQLIDAYLFQKTNYKNFIGLVLLPINVLLIYSINPQPIVFYTVFGLIFIIISIGFITSLKTYQKTIIGNIFYFILYLCALEIAPYVILYKLFI